jgi:hypothetical protein
MPTNNATKAEILAIVDRAMIDLLERDGKSLLNHPLPSNRRFGRKLLREVKDMRAEPCTPPPPFNQYFCRKLKRKQSSIP